MNSSLHPERRWHVCVCVCVWKEGFAWFYGFAIVWYRASFWPFWLQLRVTPSDCLVETKPWDESIYLLTSLMGPFSNCEMNPAREFQVLNWPHWPKRKIADLTLVKSQGHSHSLLPSCQAATWPLQSPQNLAKQDTFVYRCDFMQQSTQEPNSKLRSLQWQQNTKVTVIAEEHTIYGRSYLFDEWSCSLVRSESENLTLHAQKPWGHLPNNLELSMQSFVGSAIQLQQMW